MSFYIRKASETCIKCQNCCKELHFPIGRVDTEEGKEAADFYSIRGLVVISSSERYYVIIPHTCPHLKESGCSIYPDRPVSCRVYDGRRDQLMEGRCALSHPKIHKGDSSG